MTTRFCWQCQTVRVRLLALMLVVLCWPSKGTITQSLPKAQAQSRRSLPRVVDSGVAPVV